MRVLFAVILVSALPALLLPLAQAEKPPEPATASSPFKPGPSGLWTWTRPEASVTTGVVTLRPSLPREVERANLQVGPLNEGYLDWTADMPSATVGCRLGRPVYGPKVAGFVTGVTEVPGWCTIRSGHGSSYVVEWHASLVQVDSLVVVHAGVARGDGLFS